MAFDAHKNFGVSLIAVAPVPAASGTTFSVTAGTGALFPAAPFNVVVWPAGANPTAANAEVVRITSKGTGDNWTGTRVTESSSARSIALGDQVSAAITAKTFTDIETAQAADAAAIVTLGTSKADLASPTFTGVPAAPTAAVGTSTTQIATTAFALANAHMRLLKVGSGTSTAAGATDVDSIAISGLTANDRLLVLFEVESVTQLTAIPLIRQSTDPVSLSTLDAGQNIAAGSFCSGEIIIQQRQSGNTAIRSVAKGARGTGTAPTFTGDVVHATFTTVWTGSWTLALRHGGVTAGGTFSYTWSVYLLKGQ